MKIETIQYKKSRIYKEIEEDQYAKSLAKKVRAVRYFMCEIFGKMFYPNSWRRHAGVSLKGTDVVAENQQKHLSEFCYKSVNLPIDYSQMKQGSVTK